MLSEDEEDVHLQGISDNENEFTDYFSKCKRIPIDEDSPMFWKVSKNNFLSFVP